MLATFLAPLTGGAIVGRTCGSSPGGGRSAPVRPKDRGLNGIKTPQRTRPTSAPGYMTRHPTPRTLKPLAVREVDGGVKLRYPPPCSGGDFCNRGARRACTSSFLSPTASRSLLPSPNNNISIMVRVFFSWHAHESGRPMWARMSTVWVRFFFFFFENTCLESFVQSSNQEWASPSYSHSPTSPRVRGQCMGGPCGGGTC